jgi:16S rRNA (cytidine1402-2'-O)-methyltransferase
MSETLGILSVVATPIGNLKDITIRGLEVLRAADVIFAEDTRVTRKLLSHYAIEKPVASYHEHSPGRVSHSIIALLSAGKSIALVSDAGTPGIADPGARLIAEVHRKVPEARIVPIPGASAITAALSASGIRGERFTFLGFPPHKKGRETFFLELPTITVRPLVFFESPHQLTKTLRALQTHLGGDSAVVIAKEITKHYETFFQGTVADAVRLFTGDRARGEFVIILS